MLTMRTLGEILPWPLVVFGAGRYAAADAASWHRGSRRPVTQEERRILALGGRLRVSRRRTTSEDIQEKKKERAFTRGARQKQANGGSMRGDGKRYTKANFLISPVSVPAGS